MIYIGSKKHEYEDIDKRKNIFYPIGLDITLRLKCCYAFSDLFLFVNAMEQKGQTVVKELYSLRKEYFVQSKSKYVLKDCVSYAKKGALCPPALWY